MQLDTFQTVSECCPCRNLNSSPKEVLAVIQVEESGCQAWGSFTLKDLSLQILRRHSSWIVDFCRVSSLQRTPTLGPWFLANLAEELGRSSISVLMYGWLLFFCLFVCLLKEQRLLFCWTTYSLTYNAGQEGLVSVYSGSSEDTRLFILKLDSS